MSALLLCSGVVIALLVKRLLSLRIDLVAPRLVRVVMPYGSFLVLGTAVASSTETHCRPASAVPPHPC